MATRSAESKVATAHGHFSPSSLDATVGTIYAIHCRVEKDTYFGVMRVSKYRGNIVECSAYCHKYGKNGVWTNPDGKERIALTLNRLLDFPEPGILLDAAMSSRTLTEREFQEVIDHIREEKRVPKSKSVDHHGSAAVAWDYWWTNAFGISFDKGDDEKEEEVFRECYALFLLHMHSTREDELLDAQIAKMSR